MIEFLKHVFVWLVSPVAVLATAAYSLYRREFFLGALASAAMLLATAMGAVYLFDGYLLIYQLIYTALAAVPALMGLVAIIAWIVFAWRKIGAPPLKKAEDDVL